MLLTGKLALLVSEEEEILQFPSLLSMLQEHLHVNGAAVALPELSPSLHNVCFVLLAHRRCLIRLCGIFSAHCYGNGRKVTIPLEWIIRKSCTWGT